MDAFADYDITNDSGETEHEFNLVFAGNDTSTITSSGNEITGAFVTVEFSSASDTTTLSYDDEGGGSGLAPGASGNASYGFTGSGNAIMGTGALDAIGAYWGTDPTMNQIPALTTAINATGGGPGQEYLILYASIQQGVSDVISQVSEYLVNVALVSRPFWKTAPAAISFPMTTARCSASTSAFNSPTLRSRSTISIPRTIPPPALLLCRAFPTARRSLRTATPRPTPSSFRSLSRRASFCWVLGQWHWQPWLAAELAVCRRPDRPKSTSRPFGEFPGYNSEHGRPLAGRQNAILNLAPPNAIQPITHDAC